MAKAASKIPVRIGGKPELKTAHIDHHRIETIRIDRSAPLELTKEQVAMAGKVEAEKLKRVSDRRTTKAFDDEMCSTCRAEGKEGVPHNWHHFPWDEIELKKHCLLDSDCNHIAEVPILDEVELKARGYVDAECHHHNRLNQDNQDEPEKAFEIGSKPRQQQPSTSPHRSTSHPHVKVDPNVEVFDEQSPSAPSTASTSSAVILTAHLSGGSAGSGGPIQASIGENPSNEDSKPVMDVTARATPETTAQPIVMTKSVETASGQFEFTINFEIRFKPKRKPKDNAQSA